MSTPTSPEPPQGYLILILYAINSSVVGLISTALLIVALVAIIHTSNILSPIAFELWHYTINTRAVEHLLRVACRARAKAIETWDFTCDQILESTVASDSD